jgi:hypothetical protein
LYIWGGELFKPKSIIPVSQFPVVPLQVGLGKEGSFTTCKQNRALLVVLSQRIVLGGREMSVVAMIAFVMWFLTTGIAVSKV